MRYFISQQGNNTSVWEIDTEETVLDIQKRLNVSVIKEITLAEYQKINIDNSPVTIKVPKPATNISATDLDRRILEIERRLGITPAPATPTPPVTPTAPASPSVTPQVTPKKEQASTNNNSNLVFRRRPRK